MSGRSFVRRLLRSPMAGITYRTGKMVPLGARAVLDGVADLIADSPVPGIFRPTPEMLRFRSLAGCVAAQIAIDGVDDDIAEHLDALVRVGLLTRPDDGALSFPGYMVDAVQRAATAKRNGKRGGRPRKGESPADALRRRIGELQGELKLTIEGGKAADANPGETQNRNPELTQTETQTETQSGPTVGFSSVPAAQTLAAAASINSDTYKVAAAATDAARGPRENPGETQAKPGTETQDETRTETQPAGNLGPASTPNREAARRLTKTSERLYRGWSKPQRAAAFSVFAMILDAGIAEARVAEMLAARVDFGVNGPNYFRTLFGLDETHTEEPAASQAAASPAKPVHAAIAQRPAWMAVSIARRVELQHLLDVMDGPPVAARASKLRFWSNRYPDAWALITREMPDAAGMLEDEPAIYAKVSTG